MLKTAAGRHELMERRTDVSLDFGLLALVAHAHPGRDVLLHVMPDKAGGEESPCAVGAGVRKAVEAVQTRVDLFQGRALRKISTV
jgi:hypothetical protein